MPTFFLALRTLTRFAAKSSPITLRHLRQYGFQLAHIRFRNVQGAHTSLAMALLLRVSVDAAITSSELIKHQKASLLKTWLFFITSTNQNTMEQTDLGARLPV